MKTCEDYEDLVSAYVDGETTDEETEELFFHLGHCAECRKFLRSILQLNTFMQVNKPPMDAKKKKAQSLLKRRVALPYPVAAAMVILMLLFGTLFMTEYRKAPAVVTSRQTEYVYMAPVVDVVASKPAYTKSN